MLALEVVKARHGDCLILQWGPADKRELVLIDGGPDRVYKDFLRPRLLELRRELTGTGTLRLSLVMLSHIDDDHIQGLLELTSDIVDKIGGQPEFKIDRLWHNSFEDLIDDANVDVATNSAAKLQSIVTSAAGPFDQPAAAVLTSIPQGVQLREHARRLNLMTPMNEPFSGIVAAGVRDVPVTIPSEASGAPPLRLRVVAPSEKRISLLRRKWTEWLHHKGNTSDALTTAYTDRSVYNLSSIVVLAEYNGKSVMLTGDARGDDILQGLETEGLLSELPYHVNVLKLPHHGSINNVRPDFFEHVTADHYVASGDQVKFPNPQKQTFEWIKEARAKVKPERLFDVWLTYDCMSITGLFLPDRCHVPAPGAKSIIVPIDN
jgi:beta-lactamase superfamily II metal-dependent hydrolase